MSHDKDTIVAFKGSPIAWKKIDIILIKQVKLTSIKKIPNVFTAKSIYRLSLVPNILITTSGHNSNTKVEVSPMIKDEVNAW